MYSITIGSHFPLCTPKFLPVKPGHQTKPEIPPNSHPKLLNFYII